MTQNTHNSGPAWHAQTGRLIMAAAILHIVLGIGFYAEPLGDIVQDGLWNAIGTNADRDAGFWFMFSGVLFLMLGGLIHWVYRHTGTLPSFLGWSMLALSFAGVILMPVSGAWLVIGLAIMLIAISRRT